MEKTGSASERTRYGTFLARHPAIEALALCAIGLVILALAIGTSVWIAEALRTTAPFGIG